MVTKVKNTNIDLGSSTSGTVMPKGTTDQRPDATTGLLRFNTTTGNLEQNNGTEYQAIDLPPTISSISGTYNENSDTTVTINGSNFKSGATVTFLNGSTDAVVSSSPVVTRVSGTELTATTGFDSSPIAASITTLKVKVVNPSSLSVTSVGTIAITADPVFTEASGSLGNIFDSGRAAGTTFDAGATTSDSTNITHLISSGSLPTSMSIDEEDGEISGTPDAVGSDTTFSFTVEAFVEGADSTFRRAFRDFSITVKAPTVDTFTTAGATTFTAPFTGNFEVLVVGGGGGGGSRAGGGGGGVVYKASHPLTAGSIPLTVGGGGSSSQAGSDTVFSNITARGGGTINANGGANTGGHTPQGGQGGCASNPIRLHKLT